MQEGGRSGGREVRRDQRVISGQCDPQEVREEGGQESERGLSGCLMNPREGAQRKAHASSSASCARLPLRNLQRPRTRP